MVINISVQYSGGLLPDIILLTQGYYQFVVVVVVFFTLLTDRASTIPSNIRGCQSGSTWSQVENPFKYHVVALYLQPL